MQPANALKEMLENSIDAGSSHIDVLIKEGGFKLLQISDNGCGIDKEDLPLLCERFATSKITSFEDLNRISTYGFRGEALASISHISRVSVVTKTKKAPLAYRAYYTNGNLTTSTFQQADNVDPKPTAGKNGTQILVEDLFYNVPARLKTLRSKGEELSKIVDVVGRYAVHVGGVGINCKRFGEPFNLVSTRIGMSLEDRIRAVFGNDIANELIKLELTNNDNRNELKSKYGLFEVTGVITNSNFNNKKRIQPVFFINNRLVSCEPLKRAIQSVVNIFLPKHAMPFTYLSIELDPQNLDVNIHPTKREVRFLHEEEIIDAISELIHTAMSSVDKSRKFKTQRIISGREPAYTLDSTTTSTKKPRQENKLVRVDSQQSRLRSFLHKVDGESFKRLIVSEFSLAKEELSNTTQDSLFVQEANVSEEINKDQKSAPCQAVEPNNGIQDHIPEEDDDIHSRDTEGPAEEITGFSKQINEIELNKKPSTHDNELDNENISPEFEQDIPTTVKRRKIINGDSNLIITDRKRFNVNLDSIKSLRTEVNEYCNRPLTEIFTSLSFVGIVDEEKRLCCFQHDVKLFLCDYGVVLREFYYQVALTEFYNYGEYTLSQPIVLEQLLDVLKLSRHEGELQANDEVIKTIMNMKQMFYEYFRLTFTEDDDGQLVITTIPMLLKEIKPNLNKLPYFIYRLGTKINYNEERECLKGILKQLALFYVPEPVLLTGSCTEEDQAYSKLERDKTENTLEHILFPKVKQRFLATNDIKDSVIQIADLPGLYRVFERC